MPYGRAWTSLFTPVRLSWTDTRNELDVRHAVSELRKAPTLPHVPMAAGTKTVIHPSATI